MSDINKVFLVARLGKRPEIKYLSSGMAVLDLWVASNSYRKEKDDKVNWFSVTVFGKRAESCEKYLDTGSQIAIEGHLDYQQWEKDGQKRSAIKIIADQVQFVGGKKSNDEQAQPDPQPEPEPQPEFEPVKSEPVTQNESAPVENQQTEQQDFSSTFESPIDDGDDPPF